MATKSNRPVTGDANKARQGGVSQDAKAGPAAEAASHQPIVVLVAFGTSSEEAREVYSYVESRFRERFPGKEIRWGYTAETIVRKLRAKGVECRTLDEVLDDLRKEKRKAVVLQSLHIVPGEEFESIRKADTSGLLVSIGQPLLCSTNDVQAVLKALAPEIRKDVPTVFAAHGNDQHPEFNRWNVEFAKAVEGSYSNVVLASVEGDPGTTPLPRIRSQAEKTGAVHFVPLMIVAGEHVRNDIMGDKPESWKNIIGVKQATCAGPLGKNDAVIGIFFEHLAQALRDMKKQLRMSGK